jgi:hypothetical protein
MSRRAGYGLLLPSSHGVLDDAGLRPRPPLSPAEPIGSRDLRERRRPKHSAISLSAPRVSGLRERFPPSQPASEKENSEMSAAVNSREGLPLGGSSTVEVG